MSKGGPLMGIPTYDEQARDMAEALRTDPQIRIQELERELEAMKAERTVAFHKGWDRCEEYHKWLGEPDQDLAATVARQVRLIVALETFAAVTQEYPMSGKQHEALRRVREARCQ